MIEKIVQTCEGYAPHSLGEFFELVGVLYRFGFSYTKTDGQEMYFTNFIAQEVFFIHIDYLLELYHLEELLK